MAPEAKSANPRWGRFRRSLLATTCLSVGVGGSATAGAITEGTAPAPADFPNSSPGTLLPLGTTIVFGTLTGGGDLQDWFEFQGLSGLTPFTLLGQYNPLGLERGTHFSVFNSSNSLIGSTTLEGFGGTVSGTIPADGNLIVEVNGAVLSAPYEMALTASLGAQAPEPGTLATAGLAIAGALAWRRKRAAKG